MIIKKFSSAYENGVVIEKLQFNDSISLLVGVSGVGKTTILNSLNDLKKVINGYAINGFRWHVELLFNNALYNWSGKFSYVEENIFHSIVCDPKDELISIVEPNKKQKKSLIGNTNERVLIVQESLTIDGRLIVSRNLDEIEFSNKKLEFKLPDNESTLIVLRDNSIIKEFISAIRRITILDNNYLTVEGVNVRKFSPKIKGEYIGDEELTLDKLKEKKWEIEKKLFFCLHHLSDIFNEIVEKYKDIFPFVDKIIVKEFVYPESKTRYLILVKEFGTDNLIPGNLLSSGMSKTLKLLCYLYLSRENIVFLIDEFENSLGVNSLDNMVELLGSCEYNENIQFIMTSQHPYIINNIDIENWIVIGRDKNIIKPYNPITDLNIKNSKHETFISLLNSPLYENGVKWK